MSNIEKHNSSTAVSVVEERTITEYLGAMGLAKKLTEEETRQFVNICKASNLNPFKREAYAVKYKENFSIITGYESYIKRAERSGQLNGWKVDVSGSASKGDLRAKITIWRKDQEIPFEWEVWYQEYVQTFWKDGKQVPNQMWASKPVTMTKKVVIAQGFRLCFSEECGGMPYTADEIGTGETYDTQYQEVKEEKKVLQNKAAQLTPEQKEEGEAFREHIKNKADLLKQLNNRHVTEEEKDQMISHIDKITPERLSKALTKMKETIAEREAIEQGTNDPGIEDAEYADEEPQQEPGKPTDPMTKTQRGMIEQLLESAYLEPQEKDEVKSKMETLNKTDAGKTFKELHSKATERKKAAA